MLKFLKSKIFVKQIIIALLILLVGSFLIFKWLKLSTNHGVFEIVPDLKGKTLEVALNELEAKNMELVVQDSANYNPNYPKKSVLEQNPLSGSRVKENRKIYLILNPSEYRKVNIPNVINKTYRQVKSTLEAVGLRVGKITYVNHIGKDVVLEISHQGKSLHAESRLPITSKIDLVLGNGKKESSSSPDETPEES